ncbi:MAG TPA: MBL fold metallo-hydrolase [Albitalea sp.]|jgi:glyoxylase-like metal-dependent hydrolase (beta-lactamase superfamily II)/8-oxo-dGTP pyrophosphatase MutT (NUDIX family)|nr:MBL fold metallo-hydrolase [Albitalea sp.]
MVRPTLQLHPALEASTPRPAATLLLLRDSQRGIEVLMTRRSPTASFLPGAFVFPGGGVEPADGDAQAMALPRRGDEAAQVLAALRETFEELGVLLALRADGGPAPADARTGLKRDQPLYPQLAASGLRLATGGVRLVARWITPHRQTKRFDTAFFAARMPEGQQPVADSTEQFEPVWVRPLDALDGERTGRFPMVFPTVRTLRWLSGFKRVDAALQACAQDLPLWTSCPRGGVVGGVVERFMEAEPPFGELALVCPGGQLDHVLDWQHERAVPLLRHVQRLTAPNPGRMTGPGTNSYLVGTALSGYIVIDPGAAHAGHVGRLLALTGGRVEAIVCTHSHPDHSPAARPLADACAKETGRSPPVLGLASAATARANSEFRPDRELADGERLSLDDGEHAATLRVVHTPGHAANHLCLVLEEDGLLFSGDHVLNGSTTIVDPPDGDMSAYLDSLDRLTAACEEGSIEFILPAHGHVIGFAARAIARLKAHRLDREAKVLAAMRASPQGGPDAWVAQAYADTPQAMWPLARRSLAAHVERIRALGMA